MDRNEVGGLFMGEKPTLLDSILSVFVACPICESVLDAPLPHRPAEKRCPKRCGYFKLSNFREDGGIEAIFVTWPTIKPF